MRKRKRNRSTENNITMVKSYFFQQFEYLLCHDEMLMKIWRNLALSYSEFNIELPV